MSSPPDDAIRAVPGDTPASARIAGWDQLGNHWGLLLTYGLFSIGFGLVLALWPSETVTVVAVLIALQLLATGLLRIVLAVAGSGVDSSARVLGALTGALAIVVGLLCLRDPVQTLLYVGILLGIWCVVAGLLDIVGAAVSAVRGRGDWDLVSGLVSVLVGGFLLVNPELSLGLLVLVSCIWMFLVGGLALAVAFWMRSRQHQITTAAAPTATPAP